MSLVKTTSQHAARLVGQSLARGEDVGAWNAAHISAYGDCIDPLPVDFHGKAFADHPKRHYNAWNRHCTMYVRCRRCAPCMANRSARWRARALHEMASATRTWFGTFTIRPDARVVYLAKARQLCARREVDFDQLSEGERFRKYAAQFTPELQKYLKRVRKAHGASGGLRYLLVCEAHKDGNPHFHALIHESGDEAITKRMLVGEDGEPPRWGLGFCQFKLAGEGDPRCAFYVTKYLSKTMLVKPMASIRYGRLDPSRILAKGHNATHNETQSPVMRNEKISTETI